jgi:hypothetical protein
MESKIRNRNIITDWALEIYYIPARKEFLQDGTSELYTLTNNELPDEIVKLLEKFILEKVEPTMKGNSQTKWKINK